MSGSDGFHLMSTDPDTGREVWVKLDGTKLHVRELMHVDALIEENRAIRAAQEGQRYGEGPLGGLVARVPIGVFHRRLAPALQQDDQAYVRRFLNDGDHAAFRTKSGRV